MVSSPNLVDSDLVVNASLHRHLERRFHPYVSPFVLLYSLWYYVYLYRYDQYLGSEEWTFLTLITLISAQSLLWLSGHWSIEAKALTRYTKVTNS